MDKKKQKKILVQVTNIIEPVIQDLGYELLDVEYVMERGRWILRVYIDKEGDYISINDCVTVSKELSPILDVEDPIENPYVLEVSSPGINRPLRKEKHFVWAIGKRVRIRTIDPVEGRRNFTGMLKGFQDGVIHIDVGEREFYLQYDNIDKANLVYDIDLDLN